MHIEALLTSLNATGVERVAVCPFGRDAAVTDNNNNKSSKTRVASSYSSSSSSSCCRLAAALETDIQNMSSCKCVASSLLAGAECHNATDRQTDRQTRDERRETSER